MAGKSWPQELEVAGHIASIVGKQREVNAGPQSMDCHLQLEKTSSFN